MIFTAAFDMHTTEAHMSSLGHLWSYLYIHDEQDEQESRHCCSGVIRRTFFNRDLLKTLR